MPKFLGIGAIVLGTIGLLVSAAAIGFGWRTAARTVDKIDRIATRLDKGLSETDRRLIRVETRVSTIRSELNEIRGAAERVVTENPELPRVRAEYERLLDRLVPALDQIDATADSLRSVAAGFRAAADVVDQLNDDPDATIRVRNAADAIDHASEALNTPRDKVNALRSAKAVELTRRLILVQETVASSDMLADGLATARVEIANAGIRAVEYRDTVVFRVYTAAIANTLFWLWGGLGQLCMIGWGRRQMRPSPNYDARQSTIDSSAT